MITSQLRAVPTRRKDMERQLVELGVKDVFYFFHFSSTEKKMGLLLLFFGATKDYGVPYFLFSNPLFLTARLSSDVVGSTPMEPASVLQSD